ncbi:putative ABC multidrug transporter [Xylaria bambusicola]|uniref:putative ABC multidrug transporter n=1 Tax=Xylaria bambusicola TaxID=326684 RepID=UPI002007490E|nr:putative ABC multidrug transporter [Xylaria bambusicola]KAI0503440.1 putative ABC multidrug transporter [Xylaria bambusicola]
MSFITCSNTNDQSFGPGVIGCRDDFDFTVRFEQLFFSLTPCALFILLSIGRIIALARHSIVVEARYLWLSKLGATISYTLIELVLLVLTSTGSSSTSRFAISASSLRIVAAVCMIPLSSLENNRCPRPSVLLGAYLLITILLDIAQVRTFWLASSTQLEIVYAAVFTTALGMKLVVALLEAQKKTRWVRWDKSSHSPEETSGIYSLGLYSWLNKLAVSGYQKVLQVQDLYPLDSAMSSAQLHPRFARHFKSSLFTGRKHRLLLILSRSLVNQLLLPIIPRLALLGFTLSLPFFIESLIEYLASPAASMSAHAGYGLIGAISLISTGIALSTALYWYFQYRMLQMARGMLISAIYVKTTEAKIAAGDGNASLTLMSTDIERIYQGFRSLHEIWANIAQVAISAFLLYRQLGSAFAVPIVVVTLCALGILVPIRYTARGQRRWMDEIQRRVGLTSNVIANMKSLKISGLTAPITSFVQQLRVKELAASKEFRRLLLISATLAYLPLLTSPFLTFAIAQRTLDVSSIYTSLSYLLLMTQPLTQVFQTFPLIVGGIECLRRIQSFLESEDRHDRRTVKNLHADKKTALTSEPKSEVNAATQEPVIVIKGGRFGWLPDQIALQDIDVNIQGGSLTMVVGPIGSGKSSLCKALLGEMPYCGGIFTINIRSSKVGYCEQSPFLFNGSIRDNIVGFSPFDPARYAEVIEATLLQVDCQTLPQGHDTIIGSNGITLSGGQKQRVSLARTLYLQTDLLILDDVFSGLDADTEDQVFDRVFGKIGLLRERGTSTVLCTHSIRHLPHSDHIIALDPNGRIAEQGSFGNLSIDGGYIHSLGIKATHGADESSADTKLEINMVNPPTVQPTVEPTAPETHDTTRQTGDLAVYRVYFKSMGLSLTICFFFLGITHGAFLNFSTVWLSYWAADGTSAAPSHANGYYIGLYSLFQIIATISLAALAFLLLLTGVSRAGASLHHTALKTMVHAPLRFFTTTDQGVILNLFSQDLNLVDTDLPGALLNTISSVFVAIGQAAVIASAVPYLAISYPVIGAILYVLQRFYLRTSRQLRLLDLEAKSPLYTHFLDTSRGVVTLRASDFMSEHKAKNRHLLDTSQRPAYLLIMIQQWLAVVLNLVVGAIAILLTALATQLRSGSGITGASLVTLLSFGESLSGIIISYTQLETSIGAISRLKSFSDRVKPEEQEHEETHPSANWPQKGKISMRNVSASYLDSGEGGTNGAVTSTLALDDISLCIRPGEKVAICGRTGSGKSSLIALLLKLLEPLATTPDCVYIDGISLARLDRTTLRQQIIAIPQDAVFLPEGSSFFTNLDPYEVATLEDAQSVLQVVGMWDFIEERGGLEAGMAESTLSQGQRQLFSLARAVLRRRIRSQSLGLGGCGSEGGILLLDEVSSSVDQTTERKMQKVIQEEFRNYTIIAVSHRLDMIMDFDRVVVMEQGKVVEVGNPMDLATSDETKFGSLYNSGR